MARIVCTGGGTLGSVTPLLALVPYLRAAGHALSWIGTYTGPERLLIEKEGVPFYAIVAPKLRRYFTFKYILLPFESLIACVQSLWLVMRLRPELVLSAGGFVGVPVAWVARMCGARVIVHQQDVDVGLANRCTFPIASVVTTTLQHHRAHIRHRRVEWIGNPVRDLTPTTHVFTHLGPTIFVFGGGTGAVGINSVVSDELCEFATVIHATGKGKASARIKASRYFAYEFLGEEMKEALHRADVVVCRAGLGTLSELAFLKKAAIVIPLPGTHQEHNAQLLREHHAAIVCDQDSLTAHTLASQVNALLRDTALRKNMGIALQEIFPPHAAEKYVAVIESVLHST